MDLVNAPPSNSFLTRTQLGEPETYLPLKVFVCETCWLVQVDEVKKFDEIFNAEYAYFSSFSRSWLEHCEVYVSQMKSRLGLDTRSFVVEVASNDGYLLQFFVKAGIPCLGIEPTSGTAAAARRKGVETREVFWGQDTARQLVADRGRCDLMLGNNVLAHVPDINDFVAGFRIALAPKGTLTFEFPHLLNLIRFSQFDTIYHEHFSYLSFGTARAVLAAHGLTVYDVDELPTHGGSLRLYARHASNEELSVTSAVEALEAKEGAAGLRSASGYQRLQRAADEIRSSVLGFLCEQRRAGRRVVAYGAAAKGNTLLNYCGLKGNDLIKFVVDASPHKQGLFLPGSHIPVVSEQKLLDAKPDFVVILPWNIRMEIEHQLSYIREWGGRFVTFVPELSIS
jgi:2-polyprenyl-3-methyl-5-hydroxy-6-metoxy-1,4-benzoquinol methylase